MLLAVRNIVLKVFPELASTNSVALTYEQIMDVIGKNYWTIRNEIGHDSRKTDRAESGILEGVPAMQITIPLSHFVGYLNDVKQRKRTWLDEPEWLIDNFRFDNETAFYHPQQEPTPRDYAAWMLGHSLQVVHQPCPDALPRIQRVLKLA